MRLTGRLGGVVRALNGEWQLILAVNESEPLKAEYERLKGCDKLSIEIKQHKNHRSTDANAYAWVLMSKLAALYQTSKEEIYETMLKRYGCLDLTDDRPIVITLRADIDIGLLPGHWQHIRQTDGFDSYIKIKGSSQYDTKQMATFIDGIVSECKECGIETLPPDELERIKSKWQSQ